MHGKADLLMHSSRGQPCTGGIASRPLRLATRSANFQDLVQKPEEKVYNYFVCKIGIFCHFMDGKQENDIPEATPMTMTSKDI